MVGRNRERKLGVFPQNQLKTMDREKCRQQSISDKTWYIFSNCNYPEICSWLFYISLHGACAVYVRYLHFYKQHQAEIGKKLSKN